MMGAMGGGRGPGFDRLPSKKTAARSAPLAYRIRITIVRSQAHQKGGPQAGCFQP